jgi:hypothetical protein
MSQKRIDDANLGRVSGGVDHPYPEPGDGADLGRGGLGTAPIGGQQAPEGQSPGSGNTTPYQK